MASPQPKRPAPPSATEGSSKKPKKTNDTAKTPKPKGPGPEAQLQQSCLKENAELRNVFIKLLKEKPESIGQAQFVRDFWASRQHILRAHAVEKEQGRGRYNVLSELKPRVKEGGMKIDFGRDHVREIFRMHPVVQTAYNDLTDPARGKEALGETEFWNKFFTGRLCKKLRGERIREDDVRFPPLDRYLDMSDEEVRIRLGKQVAGAHVPHYIDLEGNESNTKYRGNAPDWDMRQDVLGDEKLPIIRRLNAVSEAILAREEAADPGVGERHAPVGMDEGTWKELQLRDLQAEAGEDQVKLNINEAGLGKRAHNVGKGKQIKSKERVDPKAVIKSLRKSAEATADGTLDLTASINFPENEDAEASDDSDDEGAASSNPQTLALRTATAQLQHLISPTTPFTAPPYNATTEQILSSLSWPAASTSTLSDLLLTHQTTTEFLHYFWSLVSTRGSTMSTELPSLIGALEKSLGRLRLQAEAAETVKQGRLEGVRKEAIDKARRMRTKPFVDEKAAGPGKRDVEGLVDMLVSAVEGAIAKGRGILKSLPAVAAS